MRLKGLFYFLYNKQGLVRMSLKAHYLASQTRRSRFILVTIVRNGCQFVSIDEILDSLNQMKGQLRKYGTEWSDSVGFELKKNNVLLNSF